MLVDGRFVGSRAVWDPSALRAAVVAVAEPASVGLSAIAALASPHDRTRDGGVRLRFGPGGSVVRAPLAPGRFEDVAVADAAEVALGEAVVWEGPGVLTFDGERDRVVADGTRIDVTIRRDGPQVIDLGRTIEQGLAAGYAVRPAEDG